MKTFLIALVVLTAPIIGLSQSKRVGTFEFIERKNGHIAKVVFKTRAFTRASHRVVTSREGLINKIDGRAPLGTDSGLPQIEIESLRLYIDGSEVPVAKSLYSDCYEPSFGVNSSFAIKFADKFESVFVFMHGSDAAGSYQVLWVLRKDGKHSRFSGACSDCGFIDFTSGFFR
jgi:hypothetical protein